MTLAMRNSRPQLLTIVLLACSSVACFDDPLPMSTTDSTSGDGDGDPASGDGDGDASGDGDGDTASGDGDGDGDASGDGDGDASGDGDGDASGDGDGDASGDGDGDPVGCEAGPYAFDYVGPMMLDAGDNPQGMVVGDVDNDGELDIVSSSRDTQSLRVFFGSGTGTFSVPQETVLGSMVFPEKLVGGAIADGVFDVVMRGFIQILGTSRARVRGDGAGGWDDYEGTSLPGLDFALASVTGDAALDLLTPANESLWVSPGSIGQESFPGGMDAALVSPAPWTTASGLIAVGLVDGDDDLDVVVTTFGQAFVGSGDGQGNFEFGEQELSFAGGPTGIALGDTTGDGNVDLIITTAGGGADAGHLFRGFGNGGFDSDVEISAPSGVGGVAAGDVDKDGLVDLAMIGSGNMVVHLSTGQGFGPAQQLDCGANQRQVALGDFNGDCVDDVVSVSSSSNRVCVMMSALR